MQPLKLQGCKSSHLKVQNKDQLDCDPLLRCFNSTQTTPISLHKLPKSPVEGGSPEKGALFQNELKAKGRHLFDNKVSKSVTKINFKICTHDANLCLYFA